MHMLRLFVACFACTVYGRRLQSTAEQGQRSAYKELLSTRREQAHSGDIADAKDSLLGRRQVGALRSFVRLLRVVNPRQAWQPNTQFITALQSHHPATKRLQSSFQNNAFGSLSMHTSRRQAKGVTMQAADDENGGDGVSDKRENIVEGPASSKDFKQSRAERLALEAKQAALEVEKLELQAAQIRAQKPEEPPEEELASPSDTVPPKTATPNLESLQSASPLNIDQVLQDEAVANNRIARLMLEGKTTDELRLSKRQIEVARARVFSSDTFYLTSVEQTSIGTVFTGNLRKESDIVFDHVTSQAAGVPELQDTSFLLLGDPLDIPTVQDSEVDPQPVFLALPAEATRFSQELPDLAITLLSILATIGTTFGFAVSMYILAVDGAFLRALKDTGGTELLKLVPWDLVVDMISSLVGLQVAHELAHLCAAEVRGVKIGAPIFLPSYPVPFTGTITKLLSLPRSRSALYDVAIAGPAFAGALSLMLYIAGLYLSVGLPTPDAKSISEAADYLTATKTSLAASAAASSVPFSGVDSASLYCVVPGGFFQSSLLLGIIATFFLPVAVTTGSLVQLHPLAVVGFCGFLVNVLQMLPIGRLDGGRVATALLGRSGASELSTGFIYALIFSFLLGNKNVCLGVFALIAAIFQRAPELPTSDDITGLDYWRGFFAGVSAAVALLTLVPLPALPPPPGATMPF